MNLKKSLFMTTAVLALPSIIQQLMTNLAQMVDNLMVGQLRVEAIAGVTITNQVFFIFTLVLSGIGSTAGIYLTQYHGIGNKKKMREVFRMSLIFSFLTGLIFFLLMGFFSEQILGFFASDPKTIADAMSYLDFLRYTFLIFPLSMAISNGFRYSGFVRLPMYLSILTVILGIVLNYGFIHGNMGFPALGVAGAGLATLLTRIFEASLHVALTIILKSPIKISLLKAFGFSKEMFQGFVKKGYGLVLNEFFWAFGIQALTVIYTQRVSANIASLSISQALGNMIFIGMGGMSAAYSILLGEQLGKSQFEEARVLAKKLLKISAGIGLGLGAVIFMMSYFVFNLYEVSPDIIATARQLLFINAAFSWLYYMNGGFYFILRSGGDTRGVVLVDSGFNWVIVMPIAFVLGLFGLPLMVHFLLVQLLELLKFYVGSRLFQKKVWLRNLT